MIDENLELLITEANVEFTYPTGNREMLGKSRYLSLLNSSGIMIGRLYLTEKKI